MDRRLTRPSPDTPPDWRRRLLWYASADANQTVLIGFAVFVMAIALVLTLSRSAIVAFVGAVGLSTVLIARDSGPRERKTALVFVALVLLLPIAWVGVDVVGSRFATRDVADLDGRLSTWADAWQVVRAFPLAGTGLNTYGTVTLFYQTTDLTHYYDAAHNDYLQLAAEGGLLVAVPAVAALTLLVLTIRSRLREISSHASEYWIRVGAMTGLLAIGVQELSDFSLQNPANAVLFSVLGGVALRSVDSSRAHVIGVSRPADESAVRAALWS
jgi:O-antigen ligase